MSGPSARMRPSLASRSSHSNETASAAPPSVVPRRSHLAARKALDVEAQGSDEESPRRLAVGARRAAPRGRRCTAPCTRCRSTRARCRRDREQGSRDHDGARRRCSECASTARAAPSVRGAAACRDGRKRRRDLVIAQEVEEVEPLIRRAQAVRVEPVGVVAGERGQRGLARARGSSTSVDQARRRSRRRAPCAARPDSSGQPSAAASRNGPCGIAARPPRKAPADARTGTAAVRSARIATTSPRSTQACAERRCRPRRPAHQHELGRRPASRRSSSLMRGACRVHQHVDGDREVVASTRIASKLPRCAPSTIAPRLPAITRGRCPRPSRRARSRRPPAEPQAIETRRTPGSGGTRRAAGRVAERDGAALRGVEPPEIATRGAPPRWSVIEVGDDGEDQHAREPATEHPIRHAVTRMPIVEPRSSTSAQAAALTRRSEAATEHAARGQHANTRRVCAR